MKKLIVSLLVIAAFVAAPVSLFAQATDQAVGKATLITPITIEWVTDLDFGILAASSVAGTAVVSAAATPALTAGGGVEVINDGTASAASFSVAGENGQAFTIAKPTTISLIGATSAATLTATLSGASTGTLSSSGVATIYVGGTLNVTENSVKDDYTSPNFDVTVAYN